jgi:inorganic phosphate transporter, PiT family
MTPEMIFILMVVVVIAALVFDFFNGFHDAANAISTIVVAKTLTPGQAVILAGMANFAGYLTFKFFGVSAVAKTVSKGIIDIDMIRGGNHNDILLKILIAALAGAVLWNILTWLLGLPTSSSHALIGGLVGGAFSALGMKVIMIEGVLRIVGFIIVAPLLGMLGAIVVTTIVIWIFHRTHPTVANARLRKLQLLSATFNAYGHGINDAQKSMGVIAMALVAGGVHTEITLDSWVVLACYTAIGMGTMMGGWRIVKTMGTSITKITPLEGFSADTSSAFTLQLTAFFGIPVSTTHVIAGSIMGVGTVKEAATVRWITARKIVWAWFLTIPSTAACAYLVYFLISLFI